MNTIKPKNTRSGHANRKHDPFYNSKGWQRYRRNYFGLYPLCVDCLVQGRSVKAVVLDHIKQRSKGGEDFPPFSEMRGLCLSCDGKRQRVQSMQ